MQPKTAIKDALIADTSTTEYGVLCAIEDVSLTATERACKSTNPLLYFDEYNQVNL